MYYFSQKFKGDKIYMLQLSKLEILEEGGYQVVRRGREVEIIFITPTIGDAASDPELGGEKRLFVVKGVVEGDWVRLTEAYVEEPTGERNRVNIRDLELWIQYINNL
jgi:hypothetical protein